MSTKALSSSIIVGIDEAGRGPLAGPVTAACAVLPAVYENKLIKDSKKLTEKQRVTAFEEIKIAAITWAVVSVGPRRIDIINIREATKVAMHLAARKVITQLKEMGESVNVTFLIDGNMKFSGGDNEQPIVKGDSLVPAISAASIIAKVTRDSLMETLHEKYPHYGLAIHKGYPTRDHLAAIKEHGPSAIHRLSFKGVREYAGKTSVNHQQSLFHF